MFQAHTILQLIGSKKEAGKVGRSEAKSQARETADSKVYINLDSEGIIKLIRRL